MKIKRADQLLPEVYGITLTGNSNNVGQLYFIGFFSQNLQRTNLRYSAEDDTGNEEYYHRQRK